MALSRLEFWDQFFEQRPTPSDPSARSEALEWYISIEEAHREVLRRLDLRSH